MIFWQIIYIVFMPFIQSYQSTASSHPGVDAFEVKPSPVTDSDQISLDLAKANQDIHWPAWFSPVTADLYTHNEITINAAPAVIFHHIVEAEKWPGWYSS